MSCYWSHGYSIKRDIMSDSSPLYRYEALSYQSDDLYSSVVLQSPFLLTLSSLISCFLIVIIVLFIFMGSYTKKSTLKGQLLPDKGVIRVYSPTKAKITKKIASNGNKVKKGDVLYTITTERNTTHENVDKAIINRLNTQIYSLTTECDNIKHQLDAYNLYVDKQDKKIQDAINHLDDRMNIQKHKMQILSKELLRYRKLLKTGVITPSLFGQQKTKLLDQKDVLDTLNLQKESLHQQHFSLLSDKLEKRNIYASQVSQLTQTIISLKNERSQYEYNKDIAITSPVDGIVVNALQESGQSIEPDKPLLSIIPSNSVLEAVVYAPSTDIGFIRKGQKVLIRYKAFPYEKFGLYEGVVSHISHTAVNYDEISDAYFFNEYKGKPLYLIKVKIMKQNVETYGYESPLLPRMQLEADVLTEKRKIYEWILEPFFSITGRY